MRIPLLLVAAMAAAPATAATRDFPVRDFYAVDLQSAATVTITTGPNFSVHADGDPEMVRRLTADVRGRTLVLGWLNDGGEVHGNNNLHVSITMPRVAGAAISGTGTIAIDHADVPQFVGDVGGAGTIRIAELNAPHTSLSMGGTGQIVAAGRTARLDAVVSGVGTLDAMNLAADAGHFDMSGTGHIRARVNGPAEVNLSGMGDVVIGGNPRCDVHKSGLGNVTCGR
jgi:hypothetical protein